ncbi:Cof-type HAD-IIB family hydrolase [Paenibacillus flagellatus]|uniref:Cof-type HAD-IIB family hydrolase n=1 Tax=Paenibacillus flagellatus TaxID=2211139 RepID=A0A2V5K800_9BACL|nr:Cof-type HAD-IIB family hydrolase [Paenibacillus flagellatus]PYI55478.1 hypothetical protein DLM86_07015 [Paenibacillus flagellatus]
MSYKLLALDIDGTLLNERGELSDKTVDSVRAACESGVTVVLCTGRSFGPCVPILNRLGLSAPIVTVNGAATIDPAHGTVIHEHSFAIGEAAPLIRHCRAHRIPFHVCTALGLYVEKTNEERIDELRRQGLIFTIVDDVLAHPLNVVRVSIDDRRRVGGWHRIDVPPRTIVRGCAVDVVHPSAGKAEAIARIARSMGIGREEVAAIGNHYNDLGLIEYAGLGIAMGNAPWPIKQRADAVTGTNRDDGVHRAIVDMIRKGRRPT